MPVETIECQIVQAQLGRYLTGESFSPDAVEEIEAHVSGCSICRAEVAQRRAALQSLLGGPAVKPTSATLVDAIREKQSHAVVETAGSSPQTLTERLGARNLSKPLMYGTALALVLVGMSYFGKNPTSMLGERAATTIPAAGTVPDTKIAESRSVETAGESAIVIEEPLGSDEWAAIGLDAWLPFEIELSNLDTPSAWYTLAGSLEPYPEEAPAEAPIAEASEVPAEPTIQATPKPTIAKPKSRPKPAAPKAPANTIRVYEPSQK